MLRIVDAFHQKKKIQQHHLETTLYHQKNSLNEKVDRLKHNAKKAFQHPGRIDAFHQKKKIQHHLETTSYHKKKIH